MKIITTALIVLSAGTASANTIQLVGATQGKATVVINSGSPKTLKVGEKNDTGIKLLAADANGAQISWQGKRQLIKVGGTGVLAGEMLASASSATAKPATAADSGKQAVTLQADSAGHFWATVSINGLPVRGMIDTGASGIALSSTQAKNMGIDYLSSPQGTASTAGGYVTMYRVTLNEVRLGDIVLYQVPAAVLEGAFPQSPLLGNTLLNRFNMDRKGDQLTLTKRF